MLSITVLRSSSIDIIKLWGSEFKSRLHWETSYPIVYDFLIGCDAYIHYNVNNKQNFDLFSF